MPTAYSKFHLLVAAALESGADADKVVDLVNEFLQANPSIIEEILPGMKLVKKPMTRKERAYRALSAMQVEKERKRRERAQQAGPIIRRILQVQPAISKVKLGNWLIAEGIKPPRSDHWSAPALTRLLEDVKEYAEPPTA